jgi:hypothetical protein
MLDSSPPPLPPAEVNPYAPPQTPLERQRFVDAMGRPLGAVRDGKLLVVQRGHESQFPDGACVRCGAPAVKTLKKTYSWHSPVLYILILVNLLVYVVVALIFRKTMKLQCGLCAAHAQRRFRLIVAGWATFTAAVIVAAVGLALETNPGLVWGGFSLLFVASLVLAVIVSRAVVLPKKITKDRGSFTGAGEEFLSQFPAVDGASRF